MMIIQNRKVMPSAAGNRSGFTLIELLIAITIFIILTTLTIATINLNLGSERVTAASRQLQAMLEGARSRAYKLQRPVGVRLMLDPNFPSEVSSMIYISTADTAGGGTQFGRLRFVDLDNDLTNNSDPNNIIAGIQQLPLESSMSWKSLSDFQLLRSGARIRIPAKTGQWYTVSSQSFLTTTNKDVMRLNETPMDVATYGLLSQNFANNTGGIYEYELDLSSAMIPLAGEDPVQLPPGTVIDLVSSKVPSQWYMNAWEPGYAYTEGSWVMVVTNVGLKVYRANNGGTSGSSPPSWNIAVVNGASVTDNDIQWYCYDVPLLDIVFTPQGTLKGAVSTEGVIHFTIAETRDTREVFENGGNVSVGLHAWDLSDRNGDGQRPDHQGSFRIVTIFAASGAVSTSPIDQTPGSNPDRAANIFNLALQGAEAK